MRLPQTFLRPIAHRGLHDETAGVIENTATAFEAAIAAGFGIECDVRAANDGTPVVHHDPGYPATDRRSAGLVRNLDATAVASYRDPDGNRLLTLGETLALVAGRVPLLVELKFDGVPPEAGFLEAVALELDRYRGPAAIMSFEPGPLRALAAMIPEVPRGIVSQRFDLRDAISADGETAQSLRKSRADVLDFAAVGASFVAYAIGDLPHAPITSLRDRQGIPVFAWTVRTKTELDHCRHHADAPICEGEAARLLAARCHKPQ